MKSRLLDFKPALSLKYKSACIATEAVFRPDISDLERSGTVLWMHSYFAADMYLRF